MTGPITKVQCQKCGRLLARRRDGTPYVHGCDLTVPVVSAPVPDWNLDITVNVSPNIRTALVRLLEAAVADAEELANLRRTITLLEQLHRDDRDREAESHRVRSPRPRSHHERVD